MSRSRLMRVHMSLQEQVMDLQKQMMEKNGVHISSSQATEMLAKALKKKNIWMLS